MEGSKDEEAREGHYDGEVAVPEQGYACTYDREVIPFYDIERE